MNTQILSKNALVINAEEEGKTNKKQMDMVNTEKRKEKQLLNYSMKTTERKVKAER